MGRKAIWLVVVALSVIATILSSPADFLTFRQAASVPATRFVASLPQTCTMSRPVKSLFRLRDVARQASKDKDEDIIDVMPEDDFDIENEDFFDDDIEEGEVSLEDDRFKEYAYDETPSPAWWEARRIDRHKVNMAIFDLFAKPKSFFPHNLKPGDTVRVRYLEPTHMEPVTMKQTRVMTFTGQILAIEGGYHCRKMVLRAMVGKGTGMVGVEMKFPIMSPMLIGIEVMRRGWIGNNKNAYFLRALLGKRNAIPEDTKRAELDALYDKYKEEGRPELIPEPDYPKAEYESYPFPDYVQDFDDWDESEYDPEKVDTRTEYEKRVIAAWRQRPTYRKYGRPVNPPAGG